jgi:peptide/nickel transport system permease protein
LFLRQTLRTWPGRLGAGLVALLVVAVLVSYVWVPYDPLHVDTRGRWLPISRAHWFGTDGAGKDLFSQVLVGARVSLYVALASAAIAGVVGAVLGLISVLTPRLVGESVAHLIDVLIAIPTLLLALVLVGLFGGSLLTVSIAIGVASGVVLARILRAEIAGVLTRDYVMAAHASGTSTWRTIRIHLMPNVAPIIIVQLSLVAALAILAEAALSFLGLLSRSRPSWGRILGELQTTVTVHPAAIIFPGAMLVLATLGFNLLGDGMRDATDPRLRSPATQTPLRSPATQAAAGRSLASARSLASEDET